MDIKVENVEMWLMYNYKKCCERVMHVQKVRSKYFNRLGNKYATLSAVLELLDVKRHFLYQLIKDFQETFIKTRDYSGWTSGEFKACIEMLEQIDDVDNVNLLRSIENFLGSNFKYCKL